MTADLRAAGLDVTIIEPAELDLAGGPAGAGCVVHRHLFPASCDGTVAVRAVQSTVADTSGPFATLGFAPAINPRLLVSVMILSLAASIIPAVQALIVRNVINTLGGSGVSAPRWG